MIYRCLDCNETFREPELKVYEEPSEYWGAQVSEEIVIELCPHCGSEDIDKVNECQICGNPTESIGRQFCDDCNKFFDRILEDIEYELKIDNDQLQDLITEHFGW